MTLYIEENPLVDEKEYPIAITWCPRPIKGLVDPRKQFKVFLRVMKRLSGAHGVMFPELTLQGNIHFHGSIRIADKVLWYGHDLPELRYKGFVKIKYIDNVPRWEAYQSKDQKEMRKILHTIKYVPYKF